MYYPVEQSAHSYFANICSATRHASIPLNTGGRDKVTVKYFDGFTADLYELADWLKECAVDTVVMESTGIYWILLYDILSERGFDVNLVNARHVKNVSGRKTDVLDCQWGQRLHSYGLLSNAFQLETKICELRTYYRHREMLIGEFWETI